MKKYIIIAFLSFISLSSIGQDKKVDQLLNKWIACFNKQDVNAAYDLYTSSYRQKVSIETVAKQIKGIFGMTGKLKSIKFISYKDHVYKYVFYSKENQIESDVSIVVSKDYQLGYLGFDSIGGTGDPPPMSKQN